MRGLIAAFAQHRIAPTLLMAVMIFSGITVAGRIEKRFFPSFEVQFITVSVAWRGAAADDVYDSVLTPLENSLRNVPDVKKMNSYAYDGSGSVVLEFPDGHDINKAADDVRRYLERAEGSLPSAAEKPRVILEEWHQPVTSVALSGNSVREIQPLARRIESQLADLDIGNINVRGLPTDEIRVLFDQRQLSELDLTIGDVAAQIGRRNVDVSAGDVGGAGNKRLLRTLEKRQDLLGIATLEILGRGGGTFRLGDIARIERVPGDGERTILLNGKPAVEFRIDQKPGGSALKTGRQVREWHEKEAGKLPPSVSLVLHSERWLAIESRMDLLIKNMLQGLVLVLAFLFLFLRASVAFWVAAGIPASFMVGLTALFFLGGSINMLTLFAFIMVTGIVVDDAIVVGENAAHRLKNGDPPARAAILGAKEMLPAVTASSFTTVGAFMPLLIIGGPIGAIIFEIPLVVICVLLASVFECFLVLPGHLYGSFRKLHTKGPGPTRQKMEAGITHFQDVIFRRWVERAIKYRGATVAAGVAMLIFSVSLFVSGAVQYRFFPQAELNNVRAQAAFVAGSPRENIEEFAEEILRGLRGAAASFEDEENLLRHYNVYYGINSHDDSSSTGDEFVEVVAELSPSEERRVLASEFARAWQRRVRKPAGVEKFSIRARGGGPPGEDLQILLSGGKGPDELKQASLDLQDELLKIPGVSTPRDDMAFGKKQAVFSLTPLGHALGLTAEEIAGQLRDAFNGRFVQTFYEGVDEIDLRVMLRSGDTLRDFSSFQVRLPGGGYAALADVATVDNRRGFDVLQRYNSRLGVNVIADIDFTATDMQKVQGLLRDEVLPGITERHGVSWSFEGKNADERETVADMRLGLLLAAIIIYTILAAVFSSWTFPLVIILTAPLSVIGAILGHAIMGYDMSILSAFGVFTLNGIVINDAIILVRDYLLRLKKAGDNADFNKLITDTACRRFRAVLLTSLTTVGGLSPLMFETSTQAQFLIPMAISVCFGLMFATVLILFLVPAYMSYHESLSRFFRRTPAAPLVADAS